MDDESMWFVSVVASGTARAWWVLRYWTPRAAELRRKARSLELGIEYQLTRDLPAGDLRRQQVEADIDGHPDQVPMTAGLVQASMASPPRGSRRWRRRQSRAVRRAHFPTAVPVARAEVVAAQRVRWTLVRVVPVVAALMLGYVPGAVSHEPKPQAMTVSAQAAYEADLGKMPVFTDRNMSPELKRQIIAYLHTLHPADGN